jgi:sec-independent protein translocase protein TatA
MGFRSIESLLMIVLIVFMVFGTRRLRDVGSDLGAAIKSFRKGLRDEPESLEEK